MLLIESEVGTGFRIDGARDLPASSLRVIVNENVTFFGEHGHRFVFRQLTIRRWRLLRLLLSQSPQPRAVTINDVKTHLLQTRLVSLLPAKVNTLAVLRPIDSGRRITYESWPPPAAIDGKFEGLRLRSGRLLRRDKLGADERHNAGNKNCVLKVF